MEIAAFIALAVISATSVGFTAWLTVRLFSFVQAVYHDGTHYGGNAMAVASAISRTIDDRAQARVKMTNAMLAGQKPEAVMPLDPIDEPPPIRMTSQLDEAHEITREARRFRRPAREPGIRDTLPEEI